MAACITYELPGSLLSPSPMNCCCSCLAVSLYRVALPLVIELSATAEFPYRLGTVGMLCEDRKRSKGGSLPGSCCVWYGNRAHRSALCQEGDVKARSSPHSSVALPSQWLCVLGRL
jgi:hypothetical protein